ncbi:PAS domain-containing protein [Rhizobium deserti]|uniref:PAS domain-containing protein n=1 Tax=Rhizobium deserti TaxID=2547961 RepID=UPI001386BA44|nr:PAS domain-containing protein [Rhizobium deserti]
MEALIGLFWSKYADLQHAIESEDDNATVALDRDLDPLLLAIFGSEECDAASIQSQFRFALDLLKEEADDRGCVRRNAHLLQTLVERYLAPQPGFSMARQPEPDASEASIIDEATASGSLDDTLLNRISDRIVLVAPGYRILYSNETNARRLEMPREQLLGRHLAEFVGLHRFRNEFEPSLSRCFAGESMSVTYAEEVDGQTVVLRCRMSPFVRASTLIGALVVIQETADRRRRPAA